MDKTGAKPLQNLVAGLMILGMAACLWFVFHAGSEINRELGPNALAVSPDGKLFVASHGKLHVFSDEKHREASYDFEPMGLPRAPADIGVRSDGRLYFANMEAGRLVVCDLRKAACDGKDLGLASWTPAHLQPVNTFKFFIDEPRSRLYISEQRRPQPRHRRRHGESPVAHRGVEGSDLPEPGGLLRAGRDHRRGHQPQPHRHLRRERRQGGQGAARVSDPCASPLPARPHLALRHGAASDGRYWVLIARDGMKDADVMLFDAKGAAVRRADLGPESDPFAIALWKDAVVVADGRNARVQAFDFDGANRREIRDDAFAEELRGIAKRSTSGVNTASSPPSGWCSFRSSGSSCCGAWRASHATEPAADRASGRGRSASPTGPGVRWIGPDPGFVQKQARNVRMPGSSSRHGGGDGAHVLPRVRGRRPLTGERLMLFAALGAVFVVIVILYLAMKDAAKRSGELGLGISDRGFHGPQSRVARDRAGEGTPVPSNGAMSTSTAGDSWQARSRSTRRCRPARRSFPARRWKTRYCRACRRQFRDAADPGLEGHEGRSPGSQGGYGLLIAAMFVYMWVRW
jgi:hypothetical protein